VTVRVSAHGGHSGEFCSHARDTLAAIVDAYASQGFAWVGITEHMPAVSDELVPAAERAAGLDARDMRERFAGYVASCRALQRRHAPHMRIYVAFEAEVCTGWKRVVRGLLEEFEPDYVVGSVHHVADRPIDDTPELYAEAAAAVGEVDELWCAYLDAQHEMVRTLRPAVVGHVDLVRLLDPDWRARLVRPEIWRRVERNLRAIREERLLLDLNVRALAKGQSEPYAAEPILRAARGLGIEAVPGDDSHGVADVGRHLEEGVRRLAALGFSTDWRRPA
jgi:histidinol-phosphatase (PHP family)